MSQSDAEPLKRELARTYPNGVPEYLIDVDGHVYRPSQDGTIWRRTEGTKPTAKKLLRTVMQEAEKQDMLVLPSRWNDTTGRALYYDPLLVEPIVKGKLTVRQLPKPGLGAMGIFGIVGFLAIIGVVIWIIVAHQSSGYPPSRTLTDYYNPAAGRSVSEIAFSPNGKKLVAADSDSGANLWNVHRSKLIHVFGAPNHATRIAFSPNGRLLAAGDYYGNVYLWSMASNHQVAKFTDPLANGYNSSYEGGVYGLAFSPSGKILAAAEFDGKVHLWSVQSRRELATFHVSSNDSGGLVGSIAFSPNGHILAVGDANGKTYLWNVSRESRVAVLSHSHSSTTGIFSVAFSPDGRTLATLQTDGNLVLWNASRRNVIGTLPVAGGGGDNCSIAFNPKGKTLAAGCNGRSTYLWDVATEQQIATLTGLSGAVDGVAFSPDGKVLAAGSDAGYIYLWNVGKLDGNK